MERKQRSVAVSTELWEAEPKSKMTLAPERGQPKFTILYTLLARLLLTRCQQGRARAPTLKPQMRMSHVAGAHHHIPRPCTVTWLEAHTVLRSQPVVSVSLSVPVVWQPSTSLPPASPPCAPLLQAAAASMASPSGMAPHKGGTGLAAGCGCS